MAAPSWRGEVVLVYHRPRVQISTGLPTPEEVQFYRLRYIICGSHGLLLNFFIEVNTTEVWHNHGQFKGTKTRDFLLPNFRNYATLSITLSKPRFFWIESLRSFLSSKTKTNLRFFRIVFALSLSNRFVFRLIWDFWEQIHLFLFFP